MTIDLFPELNIVFDSRIEGKILGILSPSETLCRCSERPPQSVAEKQHFQYVWETDGFWSHYLCDGVEWDFTDAAKEYLYIYITRETAAEYV